MSQLQSELERLQRDNADLVKKMDKMSADHGKLQEYSKQQKVQLDQQQEKARLLETDLRRLGDNRDKAPSTASSVSTGRYMYKHRTTTCTASRVSTGRYKHRTITLPVQGQVSLQVGTNTEPLQVPYLVSLQLGTNTEPIRRTGSTGRHRHRDISIH